MSGPLGKPTFEAYTRTDPHELRSPFTLKVLKISGSKIGKWLNEISIQLLEAPIKIKDDTWLCQTDRAYYVVTFMHHYPYGYISLTMDLSHYKLIPPLQQQVIEGKEITGLDEYGIKIKFRIGFDETCYYLGSSVSDDGRKDNQVALLK